MNIISNYRNIVRDYLIGWFVANIIWHILLNNDFGYLSELILTFLVSWLSQGLGYGLLHVFVERYIKRRVPYIRFLLGNLLLQLTVAFLLVVLVFHIFRLFEVNNIPSTLGDFLLMPVIPKALIFAIFINFGIALFIQINRMLGKGNLLKVAMGEYYTPKVDRRVLMFLDLRDSTSIAENIGHLRYSQLLQDCFYDLAVVDQYKAMIYQYVGDEVVMEWEVEEGVESLNCIRAFFAFRECLISRSSYYVEKYNHIPEFKAGINIGDVTIAEVGEVKREIAFHGDTINTAARIQDQCNLLGSDLLISEQSLKQLQLESWVKSKLKGEIHLKGKRTPVKIYSIEKVQ